MLRLFTAELKAFGGFFVRNGRVVLVVALALLFLTLDEYQPIDPRWAGAFVYYAALPLLSILIFFKGRYRDFGLRIGNWRLWGLHVLAVFIIGTPILLLASRSGSLREYYTIQDFNIWVYLGQMIVYLFSWEFIYRGFLLFGLKEKLGEYSVLVQMIPFMLLHFGKPEIETISTIFMGIYFGYVVYRGNSFWPALIIHLFINVGFRVIVNV